MAPDSSAKEENKSGGGRRRGGPPCRPLLSMSPATPAAIHQNFPPAPPPGSSPSTLLHSIHSSLSTLHAVLSIHHSSRQPLGPLVPDRQPLRYLTAVGSKRRGRRSMRRDKLSPQVTVRVAADRNQSAPWEMAASFLLFFGVVVLFLMFLFYYYFSTQPPCHLISQRAHAVLVRL